MLTLFPNILFLAPLAPLLIRIALALFLAYAAWRRTGGSVFVTIFAILEGIAALMLIVGVATQAAAAAASILIIAAIFSSELRSHPLSTLLLALVMALSLIVTGPGAFAFDLPL